MHSVTKRTLWSTADGETWTQHLLPAMLDDATALVAAGDRVALLTGEGALLATSTDANTWASEKVDGITYGRALAFGGGRFHILGTQLPRTMFSFRDRLTFASPSGPGWTSEPTDGLGPFVNTFLYAGK